MNTDTETPDGAPLFTFEFEQIVALVKRQRGLGNRAARRLVGRKINDRTRANWRRTGRFPIGFRDGSKKQ